jgi:hypothetical protein
MHILSEYCENSLITTKLAEILMGVFTKMGNVLQCKRQFLRSNLEVNNAIVQQGLVVPYVGDSGDMLTGTGTRTEAEWTCDLVFIRLFL